VHDLELRRLAGASMTRVMGSPVRCRAPVGTVTFSEPVNTAVWHGPVAEVPRTSKSVPPLSVAPHCVRSFSRSTQLPPAWNRESPTLVSAPVIHWFTPRVRRLGKALGCEGKAPYSAASRHQLRPSAGTAPWCRCPPENLNLTQHPFIRTSAGRPLQVLAVVEGTATRPTALRGDGPAVVLAPASTARAIRARRAGQLLQRDA
jgi:hypothetical protein